MKMWTSLSAGRWTCLLVLGGAMLVSASQAESFISLSCCYGGGSRAKNATRYDCLIQEPWKGCTSAYLVKPEGDPNWYCIRQDSRWMKMMMQKNKIKCHTGVSYPDHRSEVRARMMQRN